MARVVTSGTLFHPEYTFDRSTLTVEVNNYDYLNMLGRPSGNRLVTGSYTIQFANEREYREFVGATQSGVHPVITVELPE